MSMRTTFTSIAITATIALNLCSCTDLPLEEDALTQHIAVGTRTIKVPHMAPFVGSQAASPEVVVSTDPTQENFPGWLAPASVDVGLVIVGARAWVRDNAGAVRLEIGRNVQVAGSDPGNGGVDPLAISGSTNGSHTVQILSISGARIPVVSGTTYWLHVAFTTSSGTVQLRGLEVDVSSSL